MQLSRLVPALFAAAVAAAPAHAQQWGGSLFSAPFEPRSRLEILASDADGAGAGIAVAVRPFARMPDLRVRAGIMDGQGSGPFSDPDFARTRRETVGYIAGVDYSIPIASRAGGPLRASVVTGVGLGINHGTRINVPIGVSVGYDGGWIRPYMTPRVVLEHKHRIDIDGGAAVRGVIDWGLDVDLPFGGTLRAALTSGSYKGGGIGFSF
jgi:hypothetical protein